MFGDCGSWFSCGSAECLGVFAYCVQADPTQLGVWVSVAFAVAGTPLSPALLCKQGSAWGAHGICCPGVSHCMLLGTYDMHTIGTYYMHATGTYYMPATGTYGMHTIGTYYMPATGTYYMPAIGTYYMPATGTYYMHATGTYVMSRGCRTLRMAVPPAYKLMVQSGKHMEAHLGVAWWCWWWC
jgi:hypothetical protein